MREVWGPHMANVGAVRVYIASLRRKVEADPRLVPVAIAGTGAVPNGMN
jgi:hypothetical protein